MQWSLHVHVVTKLQPILFLFGIASNKNITLIGEHSWIKSKIFQEKKAKMIFPATMNYRPDAQEHFSVQFFRSCWNDND